MCLGNICRSPMAEGVFKAILSREGNQSLIEVDSAGLIDYHQGALPDSRMRQHASRRGYTLVHRSRPVTTADFDKFDLIVAMDNQNVRGLQQIAKNSEQTLKIRKMTDYCCRLKANEVPDPYYGNEEGFEYVIDLLEDACEGLYASLQR